ncbi:S-adenosylmethionine uptake transporter [Sinorhizobium terangae]|uniref:EamA family transporter n=1 Tax=Sinorhizobium terangae TaxID=110322 RepID=A0A6N7LM70_SINTE|nr:DMT family transporter [Sinorhizobium terangae]MBB4185012.1 S-adenosylmethionine uptake transporter [Sinorhizobium terangae]MQX18309.1 EamA family transporter [Sinorhizobium terangae]
MDADIQSPMKGILFKVLSVVIFVCMSTCIKAAGDDIATGQITFYRSAFAMVPILAFLALRGQVRDAFRTKNLIGHLARGFVGILSMSCGFYGLVHLPLPEAIAIGYAMPLLAVIFAAVFLRETVRLYRWSAVVIGLTGVLIITWPRLTLFKNGEFGSSEALGAAAVLASAALGAMAMVLVRKLVKFERTHTIVLYFSLSASVFSLATLPFGWPAMSWTSFLLLMVAGFCGGVAQILLTESYRHADMSTIAPFEYTSIVLGIAVGYLLFGDMPTGTMLAGTAIVVSAGIFIIFREHQLGLERRGARKHVTPQG